MTLINLLALYTSDLSTPQSYTTENLISIKLTPCFSVDKKNQIDVTFVFFISLLLAAQHVSGNHVPSSGADDCVMLQSRVGMCRGCMEVVMTGWQVVLPLLFYQLLNTFRETKCPSSGADDCVFYSLVLVCAVAVGRLSRHVGSQCVHFSSTSCSTCFGQKCAHHQQLTTA